MTSENNNLEGKVKQSLVALLAKNFASHSLLLYEILPVKLPPKARHTVNKWYGEAFSGLKGRKSIAAMEFISGYSGVAAGVAIGVVVPVLAFSYLAAYAIAQLQG